MGGAKRQVRRGLSAFLPFACLLLLAGCGVEDYEGQKVFRYGLGTEPKGVDPHLVTGVTENRLITALFEGLVSYHPTDDNEALPGVAKSWEEDGTYRVWTFHLREDARWHDGTPVTADDFVYAYERMLSPALGAPYADMLHILEGARAFHRGETDDFSTVGVEALGAHTLRLTLVGPTPYFLSVLKHYAWYPVPPHIVEKYGGKTDRSSLWTKPENFVGNGPFELEEWRINGFVKTAKSEIYWNAGNVALDRIHFYPIENPNTGVRLFLAGELHYYPSAPPDRIASLKAAYPDRIRQEPYFGTYFYRFNTEHPALEDPRVRRALTLCVDRQAIVEHITQGGQTPATGFTPPGIAGYEAMDVLASDPREGARLLAEAGYPGGEGFPELEILINTSEAHRAIAEAIQQMWKKHLGIDITIRNEEWKVYLASQLDMNYEICRAGWIGDYMDPITFLDMWTTGNGNNNTGWSNEEYDAFIEAARRTGDRDAHFAALKEAEALLLEALPVLPIYWYTTIYLVSPEVVGWYPKLLDNRPYTTLDLRSE